MKKSYVYITTTNKNTTLYIGVTANVSKRIWEHKHGFVSSFVKRYNVNKLVYVEEYSDIKEAIHREKCLKKWKRAWKIKLIETANPQWEELSVF